MAAKRAAAEVPLVQEQLSRQRQLWQEAEERAAKLQVRCLLPQVVHACCVLVRVCLRIRAYAHACASLCVVRVLGV